MQACSMHKYLQAWKQIIVSIPHACIGTVFACMHAYMHEGLQACNMHELMRKNDIFTCEDNDDVKSLRNKLLLIQIIFSHFDEIFLLH